MKVKSTIFSSFALIAVTVITLANSGGAPAGRTGAPGDSTCATASCHNGTLNSGNATIELNIGDDFTSFTPGEQLSINISLMNAQNVNKNGFQILALDGEGNNYGSWILTDEANTSIQSGANMREYVTHSRGGNVQDNWQVGWLPPEDELVDSVFFYLAVNDANNNGSRMGDNIYTTVFALPITPDVSSTNFLESSRVNVFPNPAQGRLQIQSDTYQFSAYRLYDLSGKILQSGNFQREIVLSKAFTPGIYSLQLLNETGQLIKKIQIAN